MNRNNTSNSVHFWNSVSKNTWGKTTYPWRPDLSDMLVYAGFLLYKKFTKRELYVLVIGATKELRLLLNALHIQYDIIDQSENMLSLTKPNTDTFLKFKILDTWLNVEKKSNGKVYDMILGDLILNLLDEISVKQVMTQCYSILKHSGILLLRTRTLTSNNAINYIDQLRKKLQKINNKNIYYIYADFLTCLTLNKRATLEIIEEMKVNDNYFLQHFLKYFTNENLPYYIYTKNKVHSFKNTFEKIILIKNHLFKTTFDDFIFLMITKK